MRSRRHPAGDAENNFSAPTLQSATTSGAAGGGGGGSESTGESSSTTTNNTYYGGDSATTISNVSNGTTNNYSETINYSETNTWNNTINYTTTNNNSLVNIATNNSYVGGSVLTSTVNTVNNTVNSITSTISHGGDGNILNVILGHGHGDHAATATIAAIREGRASASSRRASRDRADGRAGRQRHRGTVTNILNSGANVGGLLGGLLHGGDSNHGGDQPGAPSIDLTILQPVLHEAGSIVGTTVGQLAR